MGGYDFCFFRGRFVKESVLGGNVYFGRCSPHGC